MPFQSIANKLRGKAKIENPAVNQWIRSWVQRVSLQVPWQAKCLEQTLATKLMLRRRRLANKLYLGVKREHQVFTAHAWLEHEDAVGYVALECFEDVCP
ncbi:MAG: lasso peptide biosynthesis B2 protein [Myxococcota bacterium]